MKRMLGLALALSVLFGCGKQALLPYAREMGDTALVRAIGVDEWEGGVRLTAVAEGGAGEESSVLSASGGSLPAAVRVMQGLGEHYISFGHVDQILVGEELAHGGLAELMDYLARDPQLGPGAQLWVVRGGAGRALEVPGSLERLAQLSVGEGAVPMGCSASRLMSVMARSGSAYLPALAVAPVEQDDEKAPRLVADGYAILRRGKLVCVTDPETTVGLELMEGEGDGGVTERMLTDETKVALELKNVGVNCRPKISNGELVGVDVSCDLEARVAQTGRNLDAEDVEQLCRGLERQQRERIGRALELGQYWDADYLDLKQQTQLACPSEKERIRAQWDRVFRGLEFHVEVCGNVEYFGGMEG